jgi:hypothetical protein
VRRQLNRGQQKTSRDQQLPVATNKPAAMTMT